MVIRLPDLPDPWKDRYRRFDAGRWRGWLNRDFDCRGVEAVLTDPLRLMDDQNVCRWFKRHRNLLAEVRWPGESPAGDSTVVLKRYSARTPLHVLRLRFGEKRAVRHWNHAWLLRQHGINTPLPVLLALDSSDPASQGVIAVETVRAHRRARDILTPNHGASARQESRKTRQLVRCLGRYVREIHDCGIVHRDFSAANVLVPESWDPDSTDLKGQFVLLDINRVRKVASERMSANLRIQDLERVHTPEHLVEELFGAYAGDSADIAGFRRKFLKYRHGYRRIRGTRNSFIRGLLKIFTYWPRTG